MSCRHMHSIDQNQFFPRPLLNKHNDTSNMQVILTWDFRGNCSGNTESICKCKYMRGQHSKKLPNSSTGLNNMAPFSVLQIHYDYDLLRLPEYLSLLLKNLPLHPMASLPFIIPCFSLTHGFRLIIGAKFRATYLLCTTCTSLQQI